MNQIEQHIDISDEIKNIWKILETVTDPEVPVLSVIDLGIIRDIKLNDEEVEVIITPTYSGCPAMDVISINIKFFPLHGRLIG
jgi:ring-1,2-phenylacetyl-CoA epoxidase subunit PaaD